MDKKVDVAILSRQVDFRPDSFNEQELTVEVIFSTGARVLRQPFFDEPFMEELSLSPGDVRLERLNNGAPVMDTHDARSVREVIGVVQKASVDGSQGVATLKFSGRAENAGIIKDVRDGILRNVSVGYRVHKLEKVGEDNGVNILRATDWEPLEISLVPVGADDGAKVRAEESLNPCTINLHEEESVPKENKSDKIEEQTEERKSPETEVRNDPPEKVLDKPSEGERDMPNTEAVKNEAKKAEKERQLQIRDACRKAKLAESVADEFIEKDLTVDDARAEIIERLALADSRASIDSRNSGITIQKDERDSVREGMTEALLFRSGIVDDKGKPRYELSDKGRQYNADSLFDMARKCLDVAGVDYKGLTRSAIADLALKRNHFIRTGGMHTTSDFPFILENIATKTLRDAYGAAPQTFGPLVTRVTVPDFKQVSRTQLGDAPKLKKVLEDGEVTRGTMGEAREKYAVEKYARIVAITRETIVNDDVAAFTRVPANMGRKAADLESDLVWTQVTSNPTMGDGLALFVAGHGNLGPGSALDAIADLGALRELLRKQVSIGPDTELMNLTMRYLAVPAELETVAEQLVSTIQPQEFSKVNPFGPGGRTPLQLIVEPRLATLTGGSVTAYYGCADVGQIDIIELATLQGEGGPSLQSREGFDVEGMELKIRYDVAAKVIDHRGLTKDLGA